MPEGKDVRKKLCINSPKNYCCYLCSNRENCEISCSYLDTLRVSSSLAESVSSQINLEIKKYQEEIGKLSILHSKGKIGKQSFLAATNTLEHKIQELEETKENPNPSLVSASFLPESEEFEEPVNQVEKPTALWYMVPFFFGIIGGIVGYVGTKDEDKDMANSLLIFGLVWTVILILIYWFILTSIF